MTVIINEHKLRKQRPRVGYGMLADDDGDNPDVDLDLSIASLSYKRCLTLLVRIKTSDGFLIIMYASHHLWTILDLCLVYWLPSFAP